MKSLDNNRSGDRSDRCKCGLVAPIVPRSISSSMNNRHKLPLALPPSRTNPTALKSMYQSAGQPPLIADVVPQILSFCDARTLSRASCVCRSWSNMANANELWTQLCKMTFGVAPSELTPPPDPTRILYIMSHLTLRETLFRDGPSGVASGLGSRTINQVISDSTFRTFNLFRMND